MRRYRVQPWDRAPIVDRIAAALEACNVQILERPDPAQAPFVFHIKTPEGEELELICYAFTANRYRQKNRPKGVHRFQIKYGSEFARDDYHDIFIDKDSSRRVTLFFGVHIEPDWPLFVAADPEMHNPTRFSISIEMPGAELEEAMKTGWHGWERERSDVRRNRVKPESEQQAEVLVAFKAEHFMRYVSMERLCTGITAGERLLFVEKLGREPKITRHYLEELLGLAAHEILDVVSGRFRLLAAVRGGVAEHHLEQYLRHRVPGLEDLQRLDKDDEPDFCFRYRKKPVLLECKTVLRKRQKGMPFVDCQKTRASKDDPCSRYYKVERFDVLAACLHPMTERWDFSFCLTRNLQIHAGCPGRLDPRVYVREGTWDGELTKVLAPFGS